MVTSPSNRQLSIHSDIQSSHCREILGEALDAGAPAAAMRIARRDRLEHSVVQREFGLPALLFEGDRRGGFAADFACRIFPTSGEHEALRLDDFAIDAAHPILFAVGRAHAVSISAAGAEI